MLKPLLLGPETLSVVFLEVDSAKDCPPVTLNLMYDTHLVIPAAS